MDRPESRQALDGASAPHSPVARDPEGRAVDPDTQLVLPAPEPPAPEPPAPEPPTPEPPDRPRGRHEAPRGKVGGPAGVAIAVVLASVVFAGVLATWLISSADEVSDQPAAAGDTAAATTAQGGPTSRPPAQGAYGNLVVNWSFEQDLSGWQVLGEADAAREPQGRTSGSSASVRARGPERGQVGLALPDAVPAAERGRRYVASAWVRSTAAGQRVTIRLVDAGGRELSKATSTTLPGLAWRRLIVDHTVATGGQLGVQVVADGVLPGDALLVDEVVVRLG